MEIKKHLVNTIQIAELISTDLVLQTPDDGLDLLGNLYYQGFEAIIIHEKNITPLFFDLKTGIAGEILQKFSNYRVKLAIVGEFQSYNSKSIKDFMYESNLGGHINFVHSIQEALNKLS